MPRISIGDVTLNYKVEGKGEWIVLLHGLGSTLEDFDLLTLRLAKKMRILRFDQRGFGKSDKPLDRPYSTGLWADDLHRLLTKLRVDKAVVAGHSMGGRIAIHFGAKYPRRTSALIALNTTMWGSNPKGGEQLRKLARRILTAGMVAAQETTPWFKSLKPQYRHIANTIRKVTLDNDPPAYALAADAVAADFAGETDSSFISDVRCPTLIVLGDRDSAPLQGALDVHRKIKDSSFGVIPDCGHFSLYEKPDIVEIMLEDFLFSKVKN